MVISLYSFLGERYKWTSFERFSVTTKVPVLIFCLSGPLGECHAFSSVFY